MTKYSCAMCFLLAFVLPGLVPAAAWAADLPWAGRPCQIVANEKALADLLRELAASQGTTAVVDPKISDPKRKPKPVPPPATAAAQVVVTAGDPRRDTLWGIAQTNEKTLLTPVEITRDLASSGGSNAEVVDALEQLFQLNSKRDFLPALMDGVPSGTRGDPDTLLPGWIINVGP